MYKRIQAFLFIITIFSSVSIYATGKEKNSVKAYPAPAGVIQNTDFTVKVRIPGQPWQDLPEYLIKVDQVKGTAHKEENASMSYFDFAGEAEVAVTFNKGTIQTARIRPLSYNIKHAIKGNTITFKLFKPANLSIEVNGDLFHNLQLFANPVDDFVPHAKDTNLLYYGPGIHEIPGGKLRVPSGKTLYLAGGAVLKGQVLIQGVRNVRVAGRGMVDQSVKMGVRIAHSKNVSVEGIFCTQCFTGGSDSVTIRNVKAISYYGWGDGMNVMASNNVLIDGVFNRNSDDCTTVYGTRMGFTGGCKNVTMQNSTLWADVGHPILVGTHGNTPNPEVLENLNYINIDILDHKEAQLDYQGCMSLNAGDNNLIRNVRFENIRVEDFRQGQLVNVRVFFNAKYCTSPGRGVEDVLFKDITYNGNKAGTSIIAGYNENRKIKNIVFENLIINGTTITDDMAGKPKWYKTADMAKIFVGEHVEGVVFRKTQPDIDPMSLHIKGEVLNYPNKQVYLYYTGSNGRESFTTTTDSNGRFQLVVEKLAGPVFAGLSFPGNGVGTSLYIGPGYRLVFTADAKDFLSFTFTKGLRGVGTESNRFIFSLDTLQVRRAPAIEWNQMSTQQLLAYVKENQLMRDSLFHKVFDRKAVQDPWLKYFARVTKLNNKCWQINLLVNHAIDNKQMTDAAMKAFIKEHGDPAILGNIYKDEYMPSENFLLMMCNDYPVYLRALDCRRGPGACNDKQYNVELIEKIAGEYKGQIRDKALAVRMRAAIANCRSYDEWMLYKNAYPRYINALPDRKLAATLDSLLAAMGNRLVKTAIGKPAPSFTVIDSTGKTYTLADFKGKVVYIDLWASWCAPCRELIPYLTKLYDQLKNDNRIACISVAVMDRSPAWKTALRHDQPAWLQLFDNNGTVQKAYVANSIPKFILIDKQGNIVNLDAPMPDDASIMGLLKQEMEK